MVLGLLFCRSARVSFNDAPPLQTAQIEQFCINFDEVQARLAPERVTMLAKGLLRLAEASNAVRPRTFHLDTTSSETMNSHNWLSFL